MAARTFADYKSDDLLRSAVERKFEVMGEALTRIRKGDEVVLTHIRNHRDIISFRNILIHGYDAIDDRIVWNVIEAGVPPTPVAMARHGKRQKSPFRRFSRLNPLASTSCDGLGTSD